MAIEIIIPQFKSEQHYHSCVFCRKTRYEPNDCCKKTRIEIHKFPCLSCLSDYRRRYGSMSDEILDIYLDSQQREMVKHVAPDAVSDYLDQRDEALRNRPVDSVHRGIPAVRNLSPADDAAEQTKKLKRAIAETTETITWEEAKEQIEAIKKKEENF